MNDQEINLQETAADEAMNPVRPFVQSAGAQLAAAREAYGWTMEQVASQLNLAVRQIQAMESDNYAALPGLSIAKGFIRSYAKLLRIDPAPLVAAVPGEAANVTVGIVSSEALSSPFGDTRLPSMADRPVISPKWYVGLVALVLAIAGVVWAQHQGLLQELVTSFHAMTASKHDEAAATPPASAETQNAPDQNAADKAIAPEPTVPVVPQATQGNVATEVESAPVNVGSTGAVAASPAPTPASSSMNTPPVAAAPEPTPQPSAPTTTVVPSAKQEELVLKVVVDSWVEVRRADNSIVFSGLIHAGKTETIGLAAPVSLVIGNAAGVEAVFRGAPLELKANTTSNVARMSLK